MWKFKIYYILAVQVGDILIRLGTVHLLRKGGGLVGIWGGGEHAKKNEDFKL